MFYLGGSNPRICTVTPATANALRPGRADCRQAPAYLPAPMTNVWAPAPTCKCGGACVTCAAKPAAALGRIDPRRGRRAAFWIPEPWGGASLRPFGVADGGEGGEGVPFGPFVTPSGELPIITGTIEPGTIDISPGPPIKMAPDGFPAAPPFRAGNWNFDASSYVLAQNDTLSGLARLYLLAPNRWPEIYNLNRGKPGVKSPDSVAVGTVLVMPTEARDRAGALFRALPPSGRAGIPETGGGLSTGAKIALGVAGAVGVAGVIAAGVYYGGPA